MPHFAAAVTLPEPACDARAHSDRLVALIKEEIGKDGWISFSRYMELALYAPRLGYYAAGARKFGAGGDFVTAPELTPIFAECLAVQVHEVMAASAPEIIEVGAGSGALAAELLNGLDRQGMLPERYGILELSGELRERQRRTIEARAPEHLERAHWLDALPNRYSGVVLGNEVLDAMPVHLVAWTEDDVVERGVRVDAAGAFGWEDRLATGALRSVALSIPAEPPYLSEIHLAARAWIRQWGRILQRGALVLLDYGFPKAEYYHPQRSGGTLMCHYRHRSHSDPFHLPGLQDVTAHVDFSAVAESGYDSGLQVLGYCSQAQFLLNCGLAQMLSPLDRGNAAYAKTAATVNQLTSPAEMGELVKVIALGRGLTEPLVGFRRGDRTHTL